MNASQPSRRPPWPWIALSAVLAVVAVGLGIWGLSTKSDLDDARADAKAAQQQQAGRLAAARRGAARQTRVEDRTRAAYQDVRSRFTGEQTRAVDLERDISVQRSQLAQARQALANATNADDRRAAQLQAARANAAVAASCARGSLEAIDDFFTAVDLDAGAKRAVASLRRLRLKCQDAVGAT